jgi:hypothetical protein
MATLVLGAVGSALGAGFGGTILGLSGAAIGGLVGSSIGSVVDSYLLASLTPGQRIEGARLDGLRITSATEGTVLPRLFGRMRLGGQHHLGDRFPRGDRDDRDPGRGRQGRSPARPDGHDDRVSLFRVLRGCTV